MGRQNNESSMQFTKEENPLGHSNGNKANYAKESAQSALFCNLSKSGLDKYSMFKTLRAPSFGGGFVILITIQFSKH